MKIAILAGAAILLFSACLCAQDEEVNPNCKADKRLVGACFTVQGQFAWWNDPPTRRIEVLAPKQTLAIGEDTDLPGALNKERRTPPALRARAANYNDLITANFEVCPLTREDPAARQDKAGVQTVCVASVAESGFEASIRESPVQSQIALDRARQKVSEDLARVHGVEAAALRTMTNAELRAKVHEFADQLRTYGIDQKVESLQAFFRLQGDTLRLVQKATKQELAGGKADLDAEKIYEASAAIEQRMQAVGQKHFGEVSATYVKPAVAYRDELLRRLGQPMPADAQLIYIWTVDQEGGFQAAMSEAEDLTHSGFEPTADLLEGLAQQLPE